MTIEMKRREFLARGGAGVATVAGIAAGTDAAQAQAVCTTPAVASTVNLAITTIPAFELIDGETVPMLSYAVVGGSAPRVPGPVIRVTEGDEVSITISNGRPEGHGFEITGVPGASMRVASGQTCRLTFTAPAAGTYMYHDPSAPNSTHLYRLLGLHGAFIVHPRGDRGWSIADSSRRCITPYSMSIYRGTPDQIAAERISRVFEAMGNTARFPGGKWIPCPIGQSHSNQEKIWLFGEIDPRINALIRADRIAASTFTASDANLRATWTPRYFMINGRSGFDLSSGDDVVVRNYIGEPTLIRSINSGLCHHATHIHGNHLFELAHTFSSATDGFVPVMGSRLTGAESTSIGKPILHNNIWERDVWPTWPMQIRDMLLPLEVPPDIPDWERHATGVADEKFPLRYVMHDHCEMGTTAAGGNYPQGAVTHWEILGPVGGRTAG